MKPMMIQMIDEIDIVKTNGFNNRTVFTLRNK